MQLLFLHSIFSEEVQKALGWTLIHSLWQGLLAAVLAAIVIAATRRSAARIRYNLLVLVLLLFVIGTIVTFSLQKTNSVETKSATTLTDVTTTVFPDDAHYEIVAVKAKSAMDLFVTYFNTHASLFVLVWAILFLIHCIKLLTGIAGVRRLRTHSIHLPDNDWQERLNQLSKLLGIPAPIRLLESELVRIPAAIGYFKPVILVPLGLLSNLPVNQVEAILLHELAHIRRKDYLVNIVQRFTEAVFFFNPALLWISSLIRQEREACCDDVVMATTNHQASYLDALVSFQEYSVAASGYAMGISSKKHYLLNRVKRMLTRENKKLNVMEKIFLIAGLIIVTAFTFIPQKETTDKKLKKQEPNKITILGLPGALQRDTIKYNVQPGLIKPEKQELNKIMIAGLPGTLQRNTLKSVAQPELIKPFFPDMKSENKNPLLPKVLMMDTIPAPKEKETANNGEQTFPKISHNINDDGKTRNETITVTNEDGKTYKITKLNDKLTGLTIDGKDIPESEMNNYSSLLEKIEIAVKERRVLQREKMEMQRADMAERREAMKNRMNDQRDREKLSRERMNQFEGERKAMEDKRKQLMKEARLNSVQQQEFQIQMERERKMAGGRGKEAMERMDKNERVDKEKFRKQFEQERKMMEDKRREMMKQNEIRQEQFHKQLERERRMMEDRRKRLYRDSTGREIIRNDNRAGDGSNADTRTTVQNDKGTGKILFKKDLDDKKNFSFASGNDLYKDCDNLKEKDFHQSYTGARPKAASSATPVKPFYNLKSLSAPLEPFKKAKQPNSFVYKKRVTT